MNKKTLITTITLFLGIAVFSQTSVAINKNQFKIKDAPGFKEAWKAVKEGDDLFGMGKGAYYEAKERYKIAFEYNSTNPELNYKLGISFLMTDEKSSAKDYLEIAYQAKPEVAPDINYFLGKAYHIVNNFDRAIEYYSAYKSGLSNKQLKKEVAQVDLMITQCQNGKRLMDNPVRAIVEDMGSNINSEYEDYSPVVSSNDSLFVFTSRRKHSGKSKIHNVDYKFYETVYYTTKNGSEWGNAMKFFKDKKVTENTAVTGISNNGKIIFLYKGSEGKGDIYYTEFTKNKWQKPKAIEGSVNSSGKEGSAAISMDGNILYFTSERKNGVGGSDIWISKKKKNEKWDKPVNAGSVNTMFNEASVSLHPNGRVLYFSSMGHNSMGGYDIFKCDIDEGGNLSNVENMGYPINSSDDDLFYAPSFSGKIGYLSSIREQTLGATDIYKVTMLGAEKPFVVGFNEITEAGVPGKDKNIFFDEGGKMDVVPVYELSGVITDAETSEPVAGSVQLIEESTKNAIDKVFAGITGKYTVNIPEPSRYIVKALADGYMPYSLDVDFSEISKQQVDIKLDKIKVGNTMVLKNIYFDFGTAMLKKTSYAELDNIYEFLMSNTTTKIQISGFTDNIGSIEGNKMISTLRARACANYLINKGIEKERVKYKGYGFLNPSSHNHTAEGRQKNRRVEFKVLKK